MCQPCRPRRAVCLRRAGSRSHDKPRGDHNRHEEPRPDRAPHPYLASHPTSPFLPVENRTAENKQARHIAGSTSSLTDADDAISGSPDPTRQQADSPVPGREILNSVAICGKQPATSSRIIRSVRRSVKGKQRHLRRGPPPRRRGATPTPLRRVPLSADLQHLETGRYHALGTPP